MKRVGDADKTLRCDGNVCILDGVTSGSRVEDLSVTGRHREMDYTGLKLMLEGIEPKRQYKRYRLLRN